MEHDMQYDTISWNVAQKHNYNLQKKQGIVP